MGFFTLVPFRSFQVTMSGHAVTPALKDGRVLSVPAQAPSMGANSSYEALYALPTMISQQVYSLGSESSSRYLGNDTIFAVSLWVFQRHCVIC